MTQKDYIAIAEALRYARGHAMGRQMLSCSHAEDLIEAGLEGVMAAAEYIANAMKDDNQKFDRSHFLAVVRGERDLNSKPPKEKRSAS